MSPLTFCKAKAFGPVKGKRNKILNTDSELFITRFKYLKFTRFLS